MQEISLDSVDSTLWALENDTETDEEIMEGDPLDLGEIAAQALALCLDPFAIHPDRERGSFNVFDGYTAEENDGGGEVMDVEAMQAFFASDD